MFPAALITFREVLEATLIVATILGLLYKMGQPKLTSTVWFASVCAAVSSILLLLASSLLGFQLHKIYSGTSEQLIEGSLMIVSAIFITWAVFVIHAQFSSHKVQFLHHLKSSIVEVDRKGLFILVFSAVFREGIEIVLFLSTIFLSDNPYNIAAGFLGGFVVALCICALLFTATIKLPIYYAFKTTSVLLILFGAGMLARGVHELAEAKLYPELGSITLSFLPNHSFASDLIKIMLGLTRHMDVTQLIPYICYVVFLSYWVFIRRSEASRA